jgi:catechol 2,3-dioxygenase-like lactoylglutathione lyase family enzyme
VNERKPHSNSAFEGIRAIDYTVIFVRDMVAMRRFYEDVLGFPMLRELSPGWVEYRVGNNTLAPEVDQCADALVRMGVNLLSPPTDQTFGHRTLFFRDPDGNLLEVFAEIEAASATETRA